MKTPRLARFLFAVLMALLALAPSTAALALAPTRETREFHRRVDPWVRCGDVNVVGEFDITQELTTSYDRAGTPIRRLIQIRVSGTVTNPQTGRSLAASRVTPYTIDLQAGTQTAAGYIVRVAVPGAGNVLLDVGRIVFDASNTILFEAGPHPLQDYLYQGDTSGVAELCAVLAPGTP